MLYLFEDFVLNTDRRELRRGDALVPIEPKVFDLLAYTIRNRERVVSRDELLSAVWDQRIVSDSALTTCINAARSAVADTGEEQRLIKTLPRKGIRFVAEVREEARLPNAPNQTQGQPDKPSIAVLPFVNLSDDPDQDYFADGITEDLLIALSQFRWLFVIARNSSFVFKGQTADVRQIASKLGVRYLLEGSVRKAGDRVRITGQLIDATTGAHLWANRFDGALKDIFELQDHVTASVVGSIAPKLEQVEIERAKRKPTENLEAYDYYLRGLSSLHRGSKDFTDEALRLFSKSIECDPTFASAYGMAAWCFDLRKWNGWMANPAQESAEAKRLAQQAVILGRDDAVALCCAGFALAHVVGDVEFGAACIDRALALNPNLAAAWYFGGWVSSYLGEPDAGIERVVRAMQLNPLDPFPFPAHSAIAWAHFVAGRYGEALVSGKKAISEQPAFLPALRIYAAAAAMSDHRDEAQMAIARVRELDPTFRVADVKDVTPLRRPQDLARYEAALRKAGLPD